MRTKKKYIHVNQHVIRANKKHGTNDPVITIKQGSKNTYCHAVEIKGPSKVIYGGNDKPLLACGARVVIETEADVEIVKEIANLKVTDVVGKDGNIVDVIYLAEEQTKGNDSRRVFVSKKAKALLKRYLNADLSVIQSDFLFVTQKSKQFTPNTLTQLLKRLYEQVGIKHATSHSGRRTFITKLANSGVNVRVIAELASHKSIQTTQRYIDINDNLCSNAVELV